MLEIRKAIRNQFESVFSGLPVKLYYQKAPENATLPYLTFDIVNSTDDGTLERFVLDVDGWDNKENTTALETLMYDIDFMLHRRTIFIQDTNNVYIPEQQLAITFYRENRLTFDEQEKRLNHRRYIYQIRTHERLYS
jgi:hypothetical protein